MPQHALGGHYGAVVDMGWDASGHCLHTVSEDQTSRIFSACRSHWWEIARPQVCPHAPASSVIRVPAHNPIRSFSLSKQRWNLL